MRREGTSEIGIRICGSSRWASSACYVSTPPTPPPRWDPAVHLPMTAGVCMSCQVQTAQSQLAAAAAAAAARVPPPPPRLWQIATAVVLMIVAHFLREEMSHLLWRNHLHHHHHHHVRQLSQARCAHASVLAALLLPRPHRRCGLTHAERAVESRVKHEEQPSSDCSSFCRCCCCGLLLPPPLARHPFLLLLLLHHHHHHHSTMTMFGTHGSAARTSSWASRSSRKVVAYRSCLE
mmetsp:Transcript_8426/g.22500  ORF Transcript_8426/g.22500 Transcript_8426/m.22500 type:complete len:235 (+) Transcript_8426:492-1196(+)